jgi:hypothetical protein
MNTVGELMDKRFHKESVICKFCESTNYTYHLEQVQHKVQKLECHFCKREIRLVYTLGEEVGRILRPSYYKVLK